MERLAITLTMDLTDEASEGAGWYISMFTDQGYMSPPIPVSNEIAASLGITFDAALKESRMDLPQIMPSQLVKSGDNLIRKALEDQLKHAESEAAKIAAL